jgi:hypothetical protein
MRTYEKKCRRCDGTGYFGSRGGCFGCGGNAQVPGTGYVTVRVLTPEEKAQNALELGARKAVADIATKYPGDPAFYALQGFTKLETQEPERFAKLIQSVANGRILQVFEALVCYGAECQH